jgi:hypothetical protein
VFCVVKLSSLCKINKIDKIQKQWVSGWVGDGFKPLSWISKSNQTRTHIYLYTNFFIGCVYMVVAVAAERFHAICHPLKYKPKPVFYLGFVVLVSFLINIPKFLEFKHSTQR